MKLVAAKAMAYVPTDTIVSMFHHAVPEYGLNHDVSSDERAELFAPLFRPLALSLNYGWPNAVIEGDIVMPEFVERLRDEKVDVTACFIGHSTITHEQLIEYEGINRWYSDLDDEEQQAQIRGFIVERSAQIQTSCKELGIPYFDMSLGEYATQHQRALDVLLAAEPDDREYALRPLAYRFAHDTDLYEKTRPAFPPQLADLAEPLNGGRVVEVGAGTGKFTRDLVARGAEVTAVEPIGEMRRVLRRELPQITVVAGSAERLPLEDELVDLYIAVEAFHWFDPTKAWAEIKRVLRPGGRVLVASLDRRHGYEWQQPVYDLISAATKSPRRSDSEPLWKSGWTYDFTPPEVTRFSYELEYTVDKIKEMYSTHSNVLDLDDDVREELLKNIDNTIREFEARDWFPMRFDVEAWTCERRADT